MSSSGETANDIRPFHVDIPEEKLTDLRRRIAATQWPDKETVADQSQGVQLVTIQELARYWETEYDFGRLEARLGGLPQFMTEIDGLGMSAMAPDGPGCPRLPLLRGAYEAGVVAAQD